MNRLLRLQFFQDGIDRATSYLAYLMSCIGVVSGYLSIEQWVSVGLGIAMLIINIWHKRSMQKIAEKKGVFISENH
ncbi:MAG: HP1 family phage holin [Vibrio sp.]|uniref:HP1 family phage holin n=1 Tax=Vibrio sp. TaxID=678 RepID=UPI003F3BF641